MAIKLFWAGGGRNEVNFGDTLSPLIVSEMAGQDVVYADIPKCDMAAIGSILNKITRKAWKRMLYLRLSPLHVWGSGAFSGNDLTPHSMLKLHALRGHKTRDAMKAAEAITLGDPGLLIDRLSVNALPQRKRWGIIPHKNDIRHQDITALHNETDQSRVIDLTHPDIFETIALIQSCDFIVSTSLHGLVTADTFGIPNVWLRVSEDDYHTSDWKFLDYFSAIARPDQAPVRPNDITDRKLSVFEEQAFRPDRAIIQKRQQELELAFRGIGL